MSVRSFDPQAWNLLAGVALLAAGCSSRAIRGDGGTEDTTTSGPETGPESGPETGPETGPDTGPECTNSGDCPLGYSCQGGVCEYYGGRDGNLPYGCYSADCDIFEVCGYDSCYQVGWPAPDCGAQEQAISIPTDGQALALSFADVDADGRDELVVATMLELWVFESDVDTPTISPREPSSPIDMAAGDFDEIPGEDVILLDGDTLVLHPSVGDGSFGASVSNPAPVLGGVKMIAGAFDEHPFTDLLIWGEQGAAVALGDGGVLALADGTVHGAGALELTSPAPGFGLRHGYGLELFDQHGTLLATVDGSSFAVQSALVSGPDAGYLTMSPHQGWSEIDLRDPIDGTHTSGWVIEDRPAEIEAGDLDGDGFDEIVYFRFSGDQLGLVIHHGPLDVTTNCRERPILQVRSVPAAVSFGDYDGDGDDELAIRSELGEVMLLDGG